MNFQQRDSTPSPFTNPAIHPDRLQFVEQENQKLKEEMETLKKLFREVHVQPETTSGASTRAPRKSTTPQKLKKEKNDCDLDKVCLDDVGNKLLTSCYDLARCLMKRASGTSPVPSPPTPAERKSIKGFFDVSSSPPSDNAGPRIASRDVTTLKSTPKIDNDFVDYVHASMRRWGITRFTMDWERHWDDRYNQIMSQAEASKLEMSEHILMAIYWRHIKNLRRYYKRGKKGDQTLANDQEKNTSRQLLKRKSIARQLYLQEQGIHERFIEPFDDKFVNSEDKLDIVNEAPIGLAKTPTWRSEKATRFIDWIESKRRNQRVTINHTYKKIGAYGTRATVRPRMRPDPQIFDDKARIPIGLPEDFYAVPFLNNLSFAEKKALHMAPTLFDMIEDFDSILPCSDATFHSHPPKAHIEVFAPTTRANPEEDEDTDEEGEVERIADDSFDCKIEEDEEMF